MLRVTFMSILLMVSFVAVSFGQNTAPAITGPDTLDSISEGPGLKTRTAMYSATDADDDAFVWTVSGTGFSISSNGVLNFTVTNPNYEDTNSYVGTITATDIQGDGGTLNVTVNILNVEEPGSITFDSTTGTITATLSDPDGVPDTVRWSWSGIAGTDPGTATYGTVAGDAGKTLTVTAQYADPAGSADSVTARVTVGTLPGPKFSSPTATATVDENTTTPYTVGTYTATGGTRPIKYSVQGTGFTINSNSGVLTLTVSDGLDYEGDTTSYTATITATDEEGETGTMTVTVNVGNVDEPGVIGGLSDSAVIDTRIQATLSDPDVSPVTGAITWSWSGIAGEDPGNSASYTPVAGDAGKTLTVSVTYFDGVGGTTDNAMGTVRVSVPTADNKAPVLSGPTPVTVNENRKSISVGYSATDEDDDELKYSIPETDGFSIGSSTGVLTLSDSDGFDYETMTSYSVIITVSDGNGGSDTLDVTVNVVNLEEPGTITFTQTDSTVTATLADPDATDVGTVRWSWSGISGDAPTGTVATSTYSLPTDDADAGKTLTVTAHYADPMVSDTPDSVTATVTVGDTGGPTFPSPTATVKVDENTATPYTVGTYTATGGTGTLTHALTAGDTAFGYDVSTGVLTLTASPLDFEGGTLSYGATITATDMADTPLTDTMVVTVEIQDVEEDGVITFNPGRLPVGTGTVAAVLTDPDATDLGTVGWHWSGISGTAPTGTTATSTYTLVAADVAGKTLTATADYLDGTGSGSDTARATIKVLASGTNTPPVVRTDDGRTSYSFPENRPISIGLSAIDPDDVAFTWSRGDTDAAAFRLTSITGRTTTLQSVRAPDFEDSASYSVSVSANDGDQTTSLPITIAITDVDEPGKIVFDPATVMADTTAVTATVSDVDTDSLTEVRWRWSGGGSVVSLDDTSVYTMVAADAGRTLRATATYLDGTDDPSRDTATATVSVPASDNNDPVLSGSSSLLVLENRMSLSVSYSATDEDDDTLIFSVEGTDSADFSMNPESGALTYSGSPFDYETKPSYSITVKVTDGNGGSDTLAVSVTVLDVDEPGTITLSPSAPGVGDTIIAMLEDDDRPLTNLSWSWTGIGVTPPANAMSYTAVEANVGAVLTVSVTYTDGHGSGKNATVDTPAIAAQPYVPDIPGTVTFDRSSVTEGETVTATLTDPNVTENTQLGWQWKRDGADITGATSESYTAIAADVDKILTVTVTYTDAVGGEMDTADRDVGTVLAKPTPTPSTPPPPTTSTPPPPTTSTPPPPTTSTPPPPTTETPPVPTEKPDLVVRPPRLSDTSVAPGARATLSVTVANLGSGDAPSATLVYYRSVDSTISSADSRLASTTVNALKANTTSAYSINVEVPNTPGDYYYGACIGSVSGESNTTNNCSSGVKLTVSAPPEMPEMPDVTVSVPVYWIERGEASAIRRVESDDTRIDSVVTVGLQKPAELALDVVNRKVYWTDIDAKTIRRANLDGTGAQGVVTAGLNTPNGIALDVTGEKVYWTDWGTKKIQRANFDGTGVQDLVTNSRSGLSGIALDVAGGKMYWVDFGSDTIWRASLDGTEVEDLMIAGLSIPFAIALDVAGGKMYWADKGTHKIQSANLDGTGVQDLLTKAQGIDNPNSIALDAASGTMYWTESSEGKGDIKSANLDGSNVQTLFTDRDDPRSIALDIPLPPDAMPTAMSEPESQPQSTPDTSAKPEDVNGDGVVDANDILVVLANLGKTGEHIADVNGDGVVNAADAAQVVLALEDGTAAPLARGEALDVITPERVRAWLTQAKLSGENLEAILALEQLLSLLTPKQTALLANYPNPFNPETWIPYQLANDADVQISIYDISGALVRQLNLGYQRAGFHTDRGLAAYWDGRNEFGERVASGIYFYTLTTSDFSATRKMLIGK